MSAAGNGAPSSGATEDVLIRTHTDSTVMDGLSSSKVTVEYHDPSGVFALIQDDLTARLPLRNLHWKSPTRPLRSIDSLHIDLVPSKDSVQSSTSLVPPQGTTGTPTRTTEEILRPPVKEKERRHQIPGLRQTPYLKIYLLRCDDSETYKTTARKQVREWVKEHTPPSQSSSSSNTQENHDAYEWMIVHVVIPDTAAASQPRGSSSTASGEKEKSGSSSVWKRGTSTLLEKLRADFNISSKSAPDRVAQIRLPKEKVPPHMLPAPTPITSPPIAESPQEQDRAWSDVIIKFKTLILLSFDLRVSQYEEDIRKNDAQRHFPGWNFNTFFILKEGLARGFESVGLVEDALLGYDELSVGLDTVIRDQAQEGSEAQGVILDHSEDLYEQANAILKDANSAAFHDEKPINGQKKDYRGLILANNISIFDFRLYIFARQMSLLLRLGNSHSARSDLASKLQPRPGTGNSAEESQSKLADNSNGTEDLFSLAELCSRAINFITFAGRLLRDDLVKGVQCHNAKFPEAFLDNIVRSWTYSALEQILTETSTLSLPFTRYASDRSTGSSGKTLPFGGHSKEQKLRVSEQKSMIHPTRSSSLTAGRSTGDMPYATSTGQVVFENGQYNDRPAPSHDSSVSQTKNGLQELAAFRAQLVAIQRRLLEQVGRSLGWNIGWVAILSTSEQDAEMTEVDLDEDAEPIVTAPMPVSSELASPILGIFATLLVTASSSKEQFRHAFEAVSDMIVKHHMAAGQHKASESVLGDLAALKFETGDFAAAAAYFGKMSSMSSSMFAQGRWNTVETTMLKMYARCLKKLNRKDEYVRTLLDVLARSAASRMSIRDAASDVDLSNAATTPKDWLNDDNLNTTEVFNELVNFSQQLPYDVTVPMAKYFATINVEPYVRHYDDKDGFQLRLNFRHILEDEIEVKAAKIHLVSANNSQVKDIWLEASGLFKLRKGLHGLWLGCNVNTIGPYMVDKIVLEAKRIIFAHEPFTKTEATTPLGLMTSVSAHSLKAAKKARILCFPRPEAFDARVYLSHFIHIDRPRHIEFELKSGWNEITGVEIRLKAASAGLRLRTANVTVESGNTSISDKDTPGVIKLGAMEQNAKAVLKVPYDCENILQELAVKLEIDYNTSSGPFHFLSAYTIPVELPLDVNVHDHFKKQMLISKFNIKTANEIPLELFNVELQGSDEFDVVAPRRNKDPVYVYPRQPVAVTYRITKKDGNMDQKRNSKVSAAGSLALLVEYRMLNEDVRDRLSAYFDTVIASSPVQSTSRLLRDTFVERLEHRVLPHQYERIALLEKVDIGSFEAMDWQDCLDGLPQNVREAVKAWLQEWHESNKTIYLKAAADQTTIALASPFPSRQMIITVSIPQTHILHTASLRFTNASTCSHQVVATTGQPISATLQISHTRKWASPSALVKAANITSASDPIDFTYTLEANSESWLIAGQRRAHFNAKEDEVLEWQVLLVPLKPGVVLLPSIEIRARIKVREDGKEAEPINCETDYLDHGETVMVIPDLRSSTVGIGDMSLGSAKSVVWLESAGA